MAPSHPVQFSSHALEQGLHRRVLGMVMYFSDILSHVEQLFLRVSFAANVDPISLGQRGPGLAIRERRGCVGTDQIGKNELGESRRRGPATGRGRRAPGSGQRFTWERRARS